MPQTFDEFVHHENNQTYQSFILTLKEFYQTINHDPSGLLSAFPDQSLDENFMCHHSPQFQKVFFENLKNLTTVANTYKNLSTNPLHSLLLQAAIYNAFALTQQLACYDDLKAKTTYDTLFGTVSIDEREFALKTLTALSTTLLKLDYYLSTPTIDYCRTELLASTEKLAAAGDFGYHHKRNHHILSNLVPMVAAVTIAIIPIFMLYTGAIVVIPATIALTVMIALLAAVTVAIGANNLKKGVEQPAVKITTDKIVNSLATECLTKEGFFKPNLAEQDTNSAIEPINDFKPVV